MYFYIYSYVFFRIILRTIMWDQIFLSYTNNLDQVECFQVFESSLGNYNILRNYLYSVLSICFHS